MSFPMPRDIEAIFFDVNGTLWRREPHEPTRRAATHRMLELLKKEDVSDAYWEVLTRRQRAYSLWAQENLFQLSEKEIWTQWIMPEEPPQQIEPVAAELMLAWMERKGRVVPQVDAEEVLIELTQRGYRLGAISNSMSSLEIPRRLDAFGWKNHFDVVILSSELRHRKPSPELFWAAAKALQVDPVHCAYIGNRIVKDMVGCKRAGFGLGIILLPPDGASIVEQDQSMQPDAVIHSLRELSNIFPVRI